MLKGVKKQIADACKAFVNLSRCERFVFSTYRIRKSFSVNLSGKHNFVLILLGPDSVLASRYYRVALGATFRSYKFMC